jgi:general secretion pathway protein N
VLRILSWTLAGLASILLTVLVFFPAAWMASIVETQTAGRITLGDAQGSLWRGSAFIGVAPGANAPVTPLFPGRFAWRLSLLALVGQVDAEVENAAVLSQPLKLSGNWSRWQLSPSAILLPAERLQGLGAPLNTIQPSGSMRLGWNQLLLVREGRRLDLTGSMRLEMREIASRLSPIRPLGAYNLALDWRGQAADVALKTESGPLLLDGSGKLIDGRLRFSGTARAQQGQEQGLANLLNLLGQRRVVGGREVIALEFK